MTAEPENLVLELLRAIRTDVAGLREDVREIKHRITSLELSSAQVHGDFAGQSVRIDRLENHLERIDRRLSIGDA